MKRTLSFVLLSLFLAATTTSNAQLKVKQVCFDDGFGYHWYFDNLTDNGDGTYYATGHLDNAYPTGDATLWLDLSGGGTTGSVRIAAINANPDGCTFYTDSFVYTGTATINPGVSYSGSGDWLSYCFGGAINAGTWSGAGPTCNGSRPKVTPKPNAPAMAVHDAGFTITASPNPVKNFTQLQYKVSAASKVNITIYDYMHRPMAVLVNESKTAGKYSVNWNATNSNGSRVQPGMYKVVSTVNGKVYSTTIQVL